MPVINIQSEKEFNDAIAGDTLAIVDFWAVWCGPCKVQAPILEKLAEKYPEDVTVLKVNVDENPELSAQYRISSIPTMMFFKKGELQNKPVIGVTGFAPLENIVLDNK
jgi:thioredoxin 1